jgi:triose/dihydroxyacetone kinase / FAD-AMP lyase (cyclizing)
LGDLLQECTRIPAYISDSQGCRFLLYVSRTVLADKGIEVRLALVGSYMTALDMAGVSVTLMHVDEAAEKLLRAPTMAPAWPSSVPTPTLAKPRGALSERSRHVARAAQGEDIAERGEEGPAAARIKAVIQACAEACIKAEPEITRQDEKVAYHMPRLPRI